MLGNSKSTLVRSFEIVGYILVYAIYIFFVCVLIIRLRMGCSLFSGLVDVSF